MQGKLKQIQGIRALAMLGIFLAHTTMWLPDALHAYVPLLLKLGGSGVAAFFILSGFLLAYKGQTVPVIAHRAVIGAAWKKVKKLYVLYLITLVTCFVMRLPSSANEWLTKSIFMVFHVTLTQDFIPFAALINAFNAPAWFLSALFGIWMIIYLLPRRINAMLSLTVKQCVIGIIAILVVQIIWISTVKYGIATILPKRYYAWCSNWLVYNNPLICFSEYCIGVLLGRLCVRKQLSITLQNAIALMTMIGCIAYAMLSLNAKINPIASLMAIAECFVCFGIIAVMSPKSIGNRILSMGALVWFGNISGYFFLIHTASIFIIYSIADYIAQGWLIVIAFVLSILLSVGADYLYSISKTRTEKIITK